MATPKRKKRTRNFLSNTLFFGNIEEWEDYEEAARSYLRTTRRTTNTRLIVLETWLFVDHTLRQLLMQGLNLTDIDQEELDLRYNLLPRGFTACIDLVLSLRKVNHHLPPRKKEPGLIMSGRMMDHFHSHHPGFLEELKKAEDCYRSVYGLGPRTSALEQAFVKHRFVPGGWLDVADRINENWQRKARKLNSARNLAAHSHHNEKIAAQFGFTGASATAQVKKSCLSLVEELTGLKTTGTDRRNTRA